ncbi:MAG: glycosyltransferase family 4 protein [Patescibacteria group bacterium]|nr:glycosyltransferase family 4 protein [Patescibacteria group bacterium]
MVVWRIGIDARLYRQTGIGTYLRNLLFYLDKMNRSEIIFYVYLLKDDFERLNFKRKNIKKRLANFRWHTLSEQIGFLRLLTKDNLDLVHFPYFTFPFLYPRKYVLTVHDLTLVFFRTGKASTRNFFFYFFRQLIFRIFFFVSLIRAEMIITPTFSVRDQLEKHFWFLNLKNKIKVIYEGVDFQIKIKKIIRPILSWKLKNFFLYVGNFYPHKNVERLIAVFKDVPRNCQLVLVGPDDFFAKKIKKQISNFSLEKRVFLLTNRCQEEISWLYKNCLALIHPSLAEGFGLTLAEAAYFKKPILASKIEVFEEIWDHNYLAFDPRSVKDMRAKINLFLKKKNKFVYSSVLKKLSFRKMTAETVKAYLKLLTAK